MRAEAMHSNTTVNRTGLGGLPVEILLDISGHLDLATLFNFSAVNRSLNNVFTRNKVTILLQVLSREFSPFDELLQVYTASSVDDIDISHQIYRPRTIVFKRFPADKGLLILPQPSLLAQGSEYSGAVVFPNASGRAPGHISTARTSVLTSDDFGPILTLCRLVRQWEQLFPQMRWFHYPAECRALRESELPRFRRAFYRWWLYGIYYHGELPRPNVGHPMPFVSDIRMSQLRCLSTTDLVELSDLAETVKDLILHYICPRLDPAYLTTDPVPLMECRSRKQSINTFWSDQSKWGRIVKTYAKLGPEELIHYFESIYSYTRKRLITEIRLQRPSFAFDQESLHVAINCVMEERDLGCNLSILPDDDVGGIVDFGDARDDDRTVFGRDASLDGGLPAGTRALRSLSRYSPRGDDGEHLDDMYHDHDEHWPRYRTAVLRA